MLRSAPVRERVVISGVGPIMPGALCAADLASSPPSESGAHPSAAADWFDPAPLLGARGNKYLTPATRYLLAAARVAQEDAALSEDAYHPEERGVAIGTNFAVAAVHDEMDAVVLREGAQALSPMEAPNFSINLAASHVSMRYGFRAFNMSLTSPMVAGVEALLLGRQAIRSGRAALVLAGATEGATPAPVSVLLGAPPGAGMACALVLEPLPRALRRKGHAHAELGPGVLRHVSPGRVEDGSGRDLLRRTLDDALDRCLPAGAVEIHYATLDCAYRFQRIVDEALRERLAARGHSPIESAIAPLNGAYATASPVLQVAYAALRGHSSLLLSTSPLGHIALVTVHPATAEEPPHGT